MRSRTLLVLLVLSGLVLAWSAPAAAVGPPAVEAGCRYLRALFASSPAERERAARLAAVGSDAYAYASFTSALARAPGTDPGGAPAVVQCAKRQVVAASSSGPSRVYTHFRLDKRARLRSFTLDGATIHGHVLAGSGQQASVLGVRLTLAGAYQDVSGANALMVVFNVLGDLENVRYLDLSQSSYQPPTGPKVPAVVSAGVFSLLPPGSNTPMVLTFPTPTLGGDLSLPIVTAPGSGPFVSATATLPVR